MKTSKQVEQELEEEKARYDFLKNRRDELEKELDEIEKQLRPYRHNHYSWGNIQRLESELERIKLIEETESFPTPVFKEGGWGNDNNVKVYKVTPKRIYIRTINKELATISEDFINKDGSSYSSKRINIPETLKVWDKYLLNNKT